MFVLTRDLDGESAGSPVFEQLLEAHGFMGVDTSQLYSSPLRPPLRTAPDNHHDGRARNLEILSAVVVSVPSNELQDGDLTIDAQALLRLQRESYPSHVPLIVSIDRDYDPSAVLGNEINHSLYLSEWSDRAKRLGVHAYADIPTFAYGLHSEIDRAYRGLAQVDEVVSFGEAQTRGIEELGRAFIEAHIPQRLTSIAHVEFPLRRGPLQIDENHKITFAGQSIQWGTRRMSKSAGPVMTALLASGYNPLTIQNILDIIDDKTKFPEGRVGYDRVYSALLSLNNHYGRLEKGNVADDLKARSLVRVFRGLDNTVPYYSLNPELLALNENGTKAEPTGLG